MRKMDGCLFDGISKMTKWIFIKCGTGVGHSLEEQINYQVILILDGGSRR